MQTFPWLPTLLGYRLPLVTDFPWLPTSLGYRILLVTIPDIDSPLTLANWLPRGNQVEQSDRVLGYRLAHG